MKKTTALMALLMSGFAMAAPISPLEDYRTTDHSNYELREFWSTVTSMSKKMKGKDCFKRAMLWSYKLNKRYNVDSKKVFMHYTNKFNRELDDQGRTGLFARFGRVFSSNDGWDFHVAPVVSIEGNDVVLDPKMRKSPESVEQWVEYLTERGEFLLKKRHKDLLKDLRRYRRKARSKSREDVSRIESYRGKVAEIERKLKYLGLTENPNQKVDIKCQKITHISEFDRAQENAWCFYQETSMYYFGPLELRYLNYGNINWDKRLPVTDLSLHTEANFAAGRNYVVRNWDYGKLEASLDEYKQQYKVDSLSDI